MAEDHQQHGAPERAPRSLNDLLKWSIKLHDTETQPETSEHVQAMAPERRDFLEKALKSLTVDELDIIRNSLKILESNPAEEVTPELLHQKEEALENISSLIDNLDNARDLQTIGGFEVVIKYLTSRHSSLRARAADIVGNVVQNDLRAQRYALEAGTLPLLCSCFDDSDPLVRKKAIYALSGSIRHFPAATAKFFELGGMDIILKGISDEAEDVQVKAVFFLLNLLNENEGLKDATGKIGLIPVLVGKLGSDRPIFREHILNVLNVIAAVPSNLDLLTNPELNLKQRLEEILSRAKTLSREEQDAMQEEIAWSQTLHQLCFA